LGHYTPYPAEGQLAADPGIYTPLRMKDAASQPGADDFALAVGYAWPPEGEFRGTRVWQDPDKIRQAGRGVAWVITGYMTKVADLRPREIIVDQQWAEGDALVSVPGYDVRICPGSGVIAEAMLWSITAEARQRIAEHEAAVIKK
jgi:hypothetical protein